MSDNFYSSEAGIPINTTTTVATTFSGAIGAATTLKYFIEGELVTFSVAGSGGLVASQGAGFISVAAVLPVGYRPPNPVYWSIPVYDNTTPAVGTIRVNPTGQILYTAANEAAFAATGSINLYDVCFNFLIP